MRNQSSNSVCNPDREGSVDSLPRRTVRPLRLPHKAGHSFVLARGFSLIEMVLVLGIILIVTTIALPVARSSMASYQLHASVSSVSGVIQSTRYQAISQGYPFQVVFDKNAGTYQLKSNPALDGVFVNVPGSGAIPIGNTSTTLGANATLQFSPGGSVKPIPAGTMTLVLTGAGRTGTVTVSNYGNVNVVYAP
jgi:prepilin-type N-terminal cleavage/methylation domain-containing protein